MHTIAYGQTCHFVAGTPNVGELGAGDLHVVEADGCICRGHNVDEVLGVGDKAFRKKSTLAMREKMNSNKTVVLVSHNEAMVRETCHRVVWIEQGRVMAKGLVDDVMDQYAASR